MEHWAVPSKTDTHTKHVVMRREDGRFVCDCLGYTYRRKCWHIDRIMDIIKTGIQYMGEW